MGEGGVPETGRKLGECEVPEARGKGFHGRMHKRDCLCQRQLIGQEGCLSNASCESSGVMRTKADQKGSERMGELEIIMPSRSLTLKRSRE